MYLIFVFQNYFCINEFFLTLVFDVTTDIVNNNLIKNILVTVFDIKQKYIYVTVILNKRKKNILLLFISKAYFLKLCVFIYVLMVVENLKPLKEKWMIRT